MNEYQASFQQSNEQYKELHMQCESFLNHIDFTHEANRQWVAKSYRKLNHFLNQNSKTKFNLITNSQQLPDIATKYAFQVKPFQFDQSLETFSKQMEESFAGKKKCEMPLIYKTQKNQSVLLPVKNGTVLIRENNKFNLRIQAEEKSTIVTTSENSHPLRTNPQKCLFHYQKANLEIHPPSIICIVVIKEQSYTLDTAQNGQRTQTVPFRLPSNSIKIEVVTTGNKKGRLNQGVGWLDNVMVRPEETFQIVYSNSQGSQVHQYVGIETESRSRD